MSQLTCDVVVVGSGAGGAVVAHRLTEKGLKVILLEAGSFHRTDTFNTKFWPSMKNLFWEDGFQYAPGVPSVPFIQGRAVGGTTVINSAICWNLPKDVHADWVREDAFEVSGDDIEREENKIREDLHVVPMADDVARGNNNVMARGAKKMGWKGNPIDRNEKDCQGSARCLVGCPNGAKLSMEKSYVPWAMKQGMTLISDCEVSKVLIKKGRVTGVKAVKVDPHARRHGFMSPSGKAVTILADKVVVAAGAIQSPLILQRSRVPDPHHLIGSHLMAHPGLSIVGLFDEQINIWSGATQGYEVTEFRSKGLKIESLAIPPALFGVRLPGAGKALAELFDKRGHMALWAAAVRTKTQGSVRTRRPLSPIRFSLLAEDVKTFILGVRVTGEMMFAAGAREVCPGIRGLPSVARSVEELYNITSHQIKGDQIGPVATHLFGTCRSSEDPRRGVINSRFESHTVKGLYVTDASVFPSNTGVNPQLAIMGLAAVAARSIAF
jgi:choline dehydrogenase-like flavoprotein